MMDTIETIRYMGVKTSLLGHIIPAIQRVTPPNGVILDLMAGTNSVSYALKREFTVYTNDVQEYSLAISKAIILNQTINISAEAARSDLLDDFKYNLINKTFNFFESTYSGTYFSKEQCIEIDSIRYAIEHIADEAKKNLYLLALMSAMCKVQSTTGHFAQFMPSTHSRIIPLQQMCLLDEFFRKCDSFSNLVFTNKKNKAFCLDFNVLLEKSKEQLTDVDTVYLDSPYSQEQYSRFYHILETVVKYDCPSVFYKAKYRDDRFMSNFCYKNKVGDEFRKIISFCGNSKKHLVISYSTSALFPLNDLVNMCKTYYKNVFVEAIDFSHSSQGKGSNKVKEVIITCFDCSKISN